LAQKTDNPDEFHLQCEDFAQIASKSGKRKAREDEEGKIINKTS